MDEFDALREVIEQDLSISSFCGVSVLCGKSLTLWCAPHTGPNADTRVELEISPDQPVIVGRAEGGEVPYLDPAYRPTQIMPGTGQTILHGKEEDLRVSRGHFMLRHAAGGILFVNGVPQRGGGIRPPLNGTRLLLPESRKLIPGEEVLVSSGSEIVLDLPNGSRVQIDAR